MLNDKNDLLAYPCEKELNAPNKLINKENLLGIKIINNHLRYDWKPLLKLTPATNLWYFDIVRVIPISIVLS